MNMQIMILFHYIHWLKEKLVAGCTWDHTSPSVFVTEDPAGGLQLAFCQLHGDGE